jgi:hypothetical protein
LRQRTLGPVRGHAPVVSSYAPFNEPPPDLLGSNAPDGQSANGQRPEGPRPTEVDAAGHRD